MTRSIQLTLAMGLCSVMLLSGCSATTQTQSVSPSADNGTTAAKSGENATQNRQGFDRPDLYGKVETIVGNSVTLALASVPTRQSSTASGGSAPSTGGAPSGNWQESGGGQPPANFEPPAGGGQGSTDQRSSTERPSRTQGTGGNTGSGAASRRSMNLTLTGETKEILIPVGVSITSGMGNSAKTIDIADIQKDSILMIYYVEGTENIERIVVR